MPRWSLIVLLAGAVLCAGIGVGLTGVFSRPPAAAFGWTAYSPSAATVYSAGYEPIDVTWLVWAPRVGTALIALGAGTTGAVLVALLGGRRRSAAARARTD